MRSGFRSSNIILKRHLHEHRIALLNLGIFGSNDKFPNIIEDTLEETPEQNEQKFTLGDRIDKKYISDCFLSIFF